jgi:hypothetical protein
MSASVPHCFVWVSRSVDAMNWAVALKSPSIRQFCVAGLFKNHL